MRRRTLATAAFAAFAGAALAATSGTFVTLQSADMLSSNIVGLDVYDNSNNNIGTIKDIAFDQSKMVKAYILSVGGFLGMGTHYIAVEPDAVKTKFDPADKKWHANMTATKDELKAAPEFKYESLWSAGKT
jgi:sporulation protein YlmC with PRC-barrel domain